MKERQSGDGRLQSSASEWGGSPGRNLPYLALLALLGLLIVLGPARSLAMAYRAAELAALEGGAGGAADLTSSPALDSIAVPNPLSSVGFNTPDELAGLADSDSGSEVPAGETPLLGRVETAAQVTEPVPALDPEQVVDDALPRPMFLALPGGTIVSPERFYSQALGEPRFYEVILPPGYDRTTQRYPVVYLLHGVAGGANEWVEIGIHQAAAELWATGEIEPFIIVLPDGGPNYWLNHADGPRWGDLVSEDIVREIDANYRTLAEPRFRAIGGLSMGADGALQLALNRPEVFSIVGAHSPSTRLSYDRIPAPFYGDESYWQAHNPLWLIQNRGTAAELKIWIDVGDGDVWLPSAQALHEALVDQGLGHEYHELPGIHDGEYWIQHQAEYLRFYHRAFHTPAGELAELNETSELGELTDTSEPGELTGTSELAELNESPPED